MGVNALVAMETFDLMLIYIQGCHMHTNTFFLTVCQSDYWYTDYSIDNVTKRRKYYSWRRKCVVMS